MSKEADKLVKAVKRVMLMNEHDIMCVNRVFAGWDCKCWHAELTEAIAKYEKAVEEPAQASPGSTKA